MKTIPAKTIVTRTKTKEWFGTDYNMNIYRGCNHGCIYCDSRSECYRVEQFDQVHAKEDALRIIRDDLRRKAKPGVVGTGAMSDPYNVFERTEQLTRHALELLSAYGFGAAIATKGTLVTRDVDVLKEIASHSPVLVKMTITTADDAMGKRIEPNAPCSSQRFCALEKLAGQGIYCGVLLMPLLPFINDTEENVLEITHMAKESGAKFVYPWFGMSLRDRQRAYYYQQLDTQFPALREQYEKRYGNWYRCEVPNAKHLYQRFIDACRQYGLLREMKEIIDGYKMGYEETQLRFFD